MKTSEGMSNDLLNLLVFIRAEGTDNGKGEDALTVQAVPNTTSSPAPWILGTSSYSAPMAAEPALPYPTPLAITSAPRAPKRPFPYTRRALNPASG